MKTTRFRILVAVIALCLLLTSCMQQPVETQPPETQPTAAPTTEPTTQPTTEPATVPTEPKLTMNAGTVFQNIFAVNRVMKMELCFADGTVVGPYTAFGLSTNLKLTMPNSVSEIEAPDLSSCTEWLVFSSGDGSIRLTVYKGAPDILCYEKDGETVYYQAGAGEAQYLRGIFDSNEKYARGGAVFAASGSAEQVLKSFAETAYPEYRNAMAPGSIYRFTDYEVLEVSLEDAKDSALLGKITYAAKPERFSPFVMGIPMEDEAYAGWSRFEETVALERGQDGNWYEIPANEYRVLYHNEYAPYDPAAVTVDEDAVKYLAELPAQLEIQQAAGDEAVLLELAKTFLNTTGAVTRAAATDFDWTLLCTQEALERVGMQAMLKYYVQRENASGYAAGELPADVVCMDAETALVAHYQVQISFVKIDGKWMIRDVAMPFVGT